MTGGFILSSEATYSEKTWSIYSILPICHLLQATRGGPATYSTTWVPGSRLGPRGGGVGGLIRLKHVNPQ